MCPNRETNVGRDGLHCFRKAVRSDTCLSTRAARSSDVRASREASRPNGAGPTEPRRGRCRCRCRCRCHYRSRRRHRENAAARLRRRMHVCSGDRRVSACQSDVRAASPRMRHMRRRALDRPASRAMPDRPATVERRARARSGCRPAGPTVSFFGSRCGACDIRDAHTSRRARGRRSHAAPAPAVCIHMQPICTVMRRPAHARFASRRTTRSPVNCTTVTSAIRIAITVAITAVSKRW